MREKLIELVLIDLEVSRVKGIRNQNFEVSGLAGWEKA